MPRYAREDLFKLLNANKSQVLKTGHYFDAVWKIRKFKSSGRSEGVRVTYNGASQVEKIFIDEDSKSDFRLLEENIVKAVNDARYKLQFEKLKEWNRNFSTGEFDSKLEDQDFLLEGKRDPFYDPDHNDLAPQIYDEVFLNIMKSANKIKDLKTHLLDPETLKKSSESLFFSKIKVTQQEIDEMDKLPEGQEEEEEEDKDREEEKEDEDYEEREEEEEEKEKRR